MNNVGKANFDPFKFSQIVNGNTAFCIGLSYFQRDRYAKDRVIKWVMDNLLYQLYIAG